MIPHVLAMALLMAGGAAAEEFRSFEGMAAR